MTQRLTRRTSLSTARIGTALALGLALATPALSQERAATPPRITIEGEGRISAAPDMATLVLGVEHTETSARAAVDALNTGLASVLDSLSEAGIAPRDVQTSTLTLRPEATDYNSSSPRSAKEPGFVASAEMTVRVRELPRLGAVMDAAVSEGANRFRSLTFGLVEPGPLQDAARKAAVAEALRRAELYAEAAGVPLGPLISIDEIGGGQPMMMRAEAAPFGSSGAIPVAPGEVTLTARVSITWGHSAR